MNFRSRTLLSALVAAAVLLVGATAAQAKIVKLTGSTTFTPSSQATTFLSNNAIAVAPVGDATAEGDGYVFPIAAGFGNTKTFYGLLAHKGGLKFTKGERSAVVRRFVAVRVKNAAVLLAQVPGLRGGCGRLRSALVRFGLHHKGQLRKHPKATRKLLRSVRNYCSGGRVIVLARLTNLAKESRYNGVLLSADLKLSREAARLLNKLAGSKVVSAGAPLGSAESAVSVFD
jgi:hypothetical protein